jgi:hypothetical protein
MKYSIHLAVILLLAMSSWTRGENQMVVRFSDSQVKFVFEFYSDINTNTALVFSSQIVGMQNRTVKIMTEKPMDRPSVIRLVEDALDKQLGIKFRHVSLEEALALDIIALRGKDTVLVVALPPLPKQSTAGASNEVRSISFSNASLERIGNFYEAISGTQVIYDEYLAPHKRSMDFDLKVAGPMTKDTARKLLDMTLAMQAAIKVSHAQPGQTLWSLDIPRRATKAK